MLRLALDAAAADRLGRRRPASSSSAFAAIRHREAVAALEVGRREEAESFARILSSLSRSVSPDAILGAIVDELADATGADHIVVVRRRPDARVLEATLVSARPGVPDSTTLLPIADLEDPVARRRRAGRDASRSADPGRPADGPAARRRAAACADARRRPDRADRRPPAPTGRTGRRRAGRPRRVPRERPAGRRPDRRPGPPGLRPDRHAGRAADLGRRRHRRDRPVASDRAAPGRRRPAGSWAAPPSRPRRPCRGPTRIRAAEAQASTDALTGLPEPPLLRRVLRPARPAPPVGRRGRRADGRHRPVQGAQRHARPRDRRRGPARGRRRDRRRPSARTTCPARYGGEEFVVLLRNPSPEVALEVGERVRSAVGGARPAPARRRRRSACRSGSRSRRSADQPIDDLIGQADRALYRAKRAGRDRVVAA